MYLHSTCPRSRVPFAFRFCPMLFVALHYDQLFIVHVLQYMKLDLLKGWSHSNSTLIFHIIYINSFSWNLLTSGMFFVNKLIFFIYLLFFYACGNHS